jgi:heterodisulfide reductase subunit B
MKKYLYYSGCSLEATALEYNRSTRAVMAALGAELLELEDWTCCGASAAEATGYLLSLVLSARNLAIGEKTLANGDLLIPCSACYLNLRRVEDHVQRDQSLLPKINEALKEEGLQYQGKVRVRHLLEVLAEDFGPQAIRPLVKRNLTGLTVAPYYGCQALRPYGSYDDPEQPRSMEPVIRATGADVLPWSMGGKCCGAALMTTKKAVALELTAGLLQAARGADCIATVCPMCQMNLEAYQRTISRSQGEDLGLSIVYLPQLLGIAFGLSEDDLKLDLNLAITSAFRSKIAA